MATAKIVLYKSKKIGKNEHPVMLRLNQRDKIKYIASGYSCSTDNIYVISGNYSGWKMIFNDKIAVPEYGGQKFKQQNILDR